MSGVVAKLKEEIPELLVAAVFFSIGFCIIILHNRLLTEGSGIEIAGFARALVGGLIVAKVLLSVDMLPFVHGFPHKPIVYNIGWKTLLYLAASVVFLYTEPFLRNLFKGVGLYSSHSRAWHELMLPRTGATVIWVLVLLLMFVTMKELSRVIGKEKLKQVFFGSRGGPAKPVRFRDVA
jgi:hypothetical protein